MNPLTCATCPDSDDGQNCFTESITRTTRRPGGGFDRCSDKFYSGVYSATNRIRNSTSPWLSEDSFRDLADWLLDWQGNCNFEPEKVRCGDIVWVYSGWEEKFFTHYHPRIRNPYVLVTHATDTPTSESVIESVVKSGVSFLEHWFASNLLIKSPPPFISWLPLGLQGPGWSPGEWYPKMPQSHHLAGPILRRKLVSYLDGSLPTDNRVLVAFSTETNPKEREPALRATLASNFFKEKISKEDLAIRLQEHLFVVAPAGNGVDTHRLWEATLNGAVPIVHNDFNEIWLTCLPFVQLNNWSELSESRLQVAARELLTAYDAGAFDFRRTMLQFHAGRISRAAARAETKCTEEARIEAKSARVQEAASLGKG